METADVNNFNEKFRIRTKQFAVRLCKIFDSVPKKEASKVVSWQLIKSGTSMAANFRAATRARSSAEYYAKLCIALEEGDETLFWFEILKEAQLVNHENINDLQLELTELVKVLSVARKTLKMKLAAKS
jgi:four helix bundle protein